MTLPYFLVVGVFFVVVIVVVAFIIVAHVVRRLAKILINFLCNHINE